MCSLQRPSVKMVPLDVAPKQFQCFPLVVRVDAVDRTSRVLLPAPPSSWQNPSTGVLGTGIFLTAAWGGAQLPMMPVHQLALSLPQRELQHCHPAGQRALVAHYLLPGGSFSSWLSG